MTTAVPPSGGSFIAKPGPTPTLPVPVGKPEIDKVYSLDDIDPVGRREVLIYGPPGTAKTSLAATFPPPFRWIDADFGLKSLHWAFKEKKTALHCTGPHCIEAYRPVEKERYPLNPEALDRMCDMLAHWFSPGEVDKWNTLVWDSATEINLWAVYKGLHLNGQLPNAKHRLSSSDETNESAKTLLLTGQQDWKSAEGLFLGVMIDTRVDCAKFNKNLVLICHEWTETDTDGRVLRYLPALIGQLRTRITKEFDDVWYTQLFNGKEAKVQMHGSPNTVAKTRWGNIVDIGKDFDYRKMVERAKAYHGIK